MTGRKFENMLNEGKNPFSGQSLRAVGSGQGYAPVAKGNLKRVKIKEDGTW